MNKSRAIFLDRDDTIIQDKIDLFRPEEVAYFEDTFGALKLLRQKGYQLFVVTNQSGVGRGLFTEADVHAVHSQIQADVQAAGLPPFEAFVYCPHHKEAGCLCRKPEPEMILKLAKEHNIDLSKSYMIGDRTRDAEAGHRAGARGAIIGQKEHDERFPNFDTLTDFAKWVL